MNSSPAGVGFPFGNISVVLIGAPCLRASSIAPLLVAALVALLVLLVVPRLVSASLVVAPLVPELVAPDFRAPFLVALCDAVFFVPGTTAGVAANTGLMMLNTRFAVITIENEHSCCFFIVFCFSDDSDRSFSYTLKRGKIIEFVKLSLFKMKTRRLNKFFVCVLALSILAGIGFGFLSPRTSMLQEMEPSELLQILNDSSRASERIESVTLGHDPDPHWIVKFKNPPSERVVRNLESDEADEAGQKLTQNRIRIILPQLEQSGFSLLMQGIFGPRE